MRTHPLLISLAGLALVGACSRGADSHADDALKNDLALAAQAQPYAASQFVSPTEQQFGATAPAPRYAGAPQPAYRAPAPVYRAPARRTASRTRRSGGGSSRAGSSGTYYPSEPSAPAEPVRHTTRDAAIGAAAGAVIGATTSRDRVKGGIIGAAAGGILGGIIGHTIDVKNP